MTKLIKRLICFFTDHRGPLRFDSSDRRYKVYCSRCGNKGDGVIDDNF